MRRFVDTLIALSILNSTEPNNNDKKNTSNSFWRIFELNAVHFVLRYNYYKNIFFFHFNVIKAIYHWKGLGILWLTPTKKNHYTYQIPQCKSKNKDELIWNHHTMAVTKSIPQIILSWVSMMNSTDQPIKRIQTDFFAPKIFEIFAVHERNVIGDKAAKKDTKERWKKWEMNAQCDSVEKMLLLIFYLKFIMSLKPDLKPKTLFAKRNH